MTEIRQVSRCSCTAKEETRTTWRLRMVSGRLDESKQAFPSEQTDLVLVCLGFNVKNRNINNDSVRLP